MNLSLLVQNRISEPNFQEKMPFCCFVSCFRLNFKEHSIVQREKIWQPWAIAAAPVGWWIASWKVDRLEMQPSVLCALQKRLRVGLATSKIDAGRKEILLCADYIIGAILSPRCRQLFDLIFLACREMFFFFTRMVVVSQYSGEIFVAVLMKRDNE